MEAHIHDIVTSAGQVLQNPILPAAFVGGVISLVTGFAGRIAIYVEDFMHDRTLARTETRGDRS